MEVAENDGSGGDSGMGGLGRGADEVGQGRGMGRGGKGLKGRRWKGARIVVFSLILMSTTWN